MQDTDNTVPTAIGLVDLLRLVRRRLALIMSLTAALTVAAAVVLAGVAPRYSASALLLVDDWTLNPVSLEIASNRVAGDPEIVMSEIEMLRSTRLANEVIDQLKLDELPELNPELRPPGVFERLLSDGGEAVAAENRVDGQRMRVIEVFLDRLTVVSRPDSRVISVEFSSQDAKLAADVANALSQRYLDDQLESKFEAVQRATIWLNDRISAVRENVQQSERRVEAFREESGLLESGGATLTDQEVSQLNTELVQASSARAAIEAKLDQVRHLATSEDGIETVEEVLLSPLIQRLREQQVVVLRQVAEMSTEYGEQHPIMVKLRADSVDLESKIDAEITKIVRGLEGELLIARGREDAAKVKLDSAKLRVSENNKALVTLRSLEREAQANRVLLETMLTRFAETTAQNDLASQRPHARVISEALAPDQPSYPPSKAILAVVFVSAGFFGLMLAFVRELVDDRVRSSEQLELAAGLRSFGMIPCLKRGQLAARGPADYLLDHPASAYSEAVRTVFALLVRMPGGPKSHSVLVTSSQTRDGKSTLAASLARTAAAAGRRVIVVDADCRDSNIARIMDVDCETGLTDVLHGRVTLDEAIVADARSATDVLCAGPLPKNPPAMLASDRVKELFERLAERYEYVIIDSPPILAVSDAVVLSSAVDSTLLVARWGATRRASASFAAKELTNAGANLVGAVLATVDVKEYARYGYGNSGVYTGALRRYYHTDPG